MWVLLTVLIAIAAILASAGKADAESAPSITFRDAKAASVYTHRELAEMLVVHGKAKVEVRGCARKSRTVIVCRVVVTGDAQTINDRCFVRLTPGGNYATWVRDVRTAPR